MNAIDFYPYYTALGVLGILPPLLILLYFLKLRRRPLEVPSTYLWHRTIEDLHVNAIWQRLRQNLLLFLQLLFFALIAFALFNPTMTGQEIVDKRLIFLIDTSASMSATDTGPSRLEEAKRQAAEAVEAMGKNSVAMVISFSDTARVEQPFSANKNVLLPKIRNIQPTSRTSSLDEALRAAAGLANPGRSGDVTQGDIPAAPPEPADLYIYSDGGFNSIPNFALGLLQPKYMKIGEDAADNVAITGFSTERNPETGKMQAFARLENYGPSPVTIDVTLSVNGEFRDAKQRDLPGRAENPGVAGVDFDLNDDDEGVLQLQIDRKDALAIDNQAYAVLNAPRPARVLVVTASESTALKLALSTEEAQKISQVTFIGPSVLEDKKHQDDANSGVYDLIIYDRCAPKTPPQANTLFLGLAPPFEGWPPAEKRGSPNIIDIDRVHPLTQLVEMSNVLITETNIVPKPKGGVELIDADVGPVYTIAPRQSFEDAALGFALSSTTDAGDEKPVTDWPRRKSFPVFVMNAVKYLGGSRGGSQLFSVRPGNPYPIRTVLPVDTVTVTPPDGRAIEVRRELQSTINFTDTHDIGVYEVREGSGTKVSQQFCVNLFDPRESDLKAAEVLPIGHEVVEAEAKSSSQSARKELWKWIVLLGLGIVLLEWYIYNKRVYL